ncbi:MAG TPA: Rrf2 family transcriptional regulator [Acidimicrobiales bacterium]|nr:Rrf2 family transcriptional regulator [Acidimicrobiales bacterium]
MRMSEGVEWAAHCAVVLAALPDGEVLPAARLAEYHGVPGPYLAKSLQALARAGLVEATTGRRGGYRLRRPASEITLLDVYRAVEGDEGFFRCTEIRQRAPVPRPARSYRTTCGIAAAMARAEAAWRDQLAGATVADLLAGVLRQAPPAVLAGTAVWLQSALHRT